MSKSNIRWKAFPRDALPSALFGTKSAGVSARFSFERYDLLGDSVVAGFPEAKVESDYNPPCIFVVADESAAETFSWLRVYSPETFPLSQFGRVLSADEWKRFEQPSDYPYPSHQIRHDRWASVIVGEALAQAEADVELTHLPLSRASACFTTAIARAASLHGTDEATRICADRLRLIEADRRFAKRQVSVSDLVPVWALVGTPLSDEFSFYEAIEVVLDALMRYQPRNVGLRARAATLDAYPELSSDSIEERVLAFQRLANDLIDTDIDSFGPRNGVPAALLAAAAFMVGRSTSHQFLLGRIGGLFPAAPVWFGLIAALVGANGWDPEWTRATKGIERQVRTEFQWTDSSGFDLAWAEFAWLAGTFDGPEIFASLPKLAARAMLIEIVPGAACQFRLTSGAASESEAKASRPTSEREAELRSTLAQFVGLATRARALLEGQSLPSQQTFSFEGEKPAKTPKPKRGRAKSE